MSSPPIRIPIFDATIQHRRLLPSLEAVLREVLLGAQWDVVPQVRGLEQEMSAVLGGGHAVGVQSGTAALFLSLKALGIGPGDDVVTVPNSDIATTAAISHTGARFVLCDIEPETMTMDPADLERRLTPRTRAIMPVHLYGHPADMGAIMAIARRRGLAVVEDAALALGATAGGQTVGLIGDAGAVSFAAHKVIGGAGNGGMVLTRDPDLAERVRLLRGYGQHPARQELPPTERHRLDRLEHLVEGYNLRLDSLQAAIVRVKLPHLRAWQVERQALADRYAAHFAGTPVRAPIVRPGCTHAWRNYMVRVSDRDRVREVLLGRGIGVNTLYAPPVHLQPVYSSLGLGPGSFPVAERVAGELLGLPLYPGLTPDAVDEVAAAVLDAVSTGRGSART
ncbi:MAG: DegT/DnrJ/EryC1/StrS family aminotransferase [Armatimonadota bacterium]|nr:DegT/DnrJ/EryC1/StrS family aminotransferase [Armatimonadota bacterium]